MLTVKWRGRRSPLFWLGLTVSLWLLAGCASLCTKHLYLYREGEKKTTTPETALLVADPNLILAAMPGANLNLQGAQWAPEQPFYQTEAYRLSLDTIDGQKFYQGMCLDNLATYAAEVRPGARRVGVRADLLGPEGQEKFTEEVSLKLEPGKVYFLRPDWGELQSRRLIVKLEPLPEAYTAGVRARFLDYQRKTVKGASLD